MDKRSPTPPPARRCGACRHWAGWRPNGQPLGKAANCQRYPPIPAPGAGLLRPITRADEPACGEFKP